MERTCSIGIDDAHFEGSHVLFHHFCPPPWPFLSKRWRRQGNNGQSKAHPDVHIRPVLYLCRSSKFVGQRDSNLSHFLVTLSILSMRTVRIRYKYKSGPYIQNLRVYTAHSTFWVPSILLSGPGAGEPQFTCFATVS